ncbi:unnamed protein product, partial [Mesorhabditis spiculigera]
MKFSAISLIFVSAIFIANSRAQYLVGKRIPISKAFGLTTEENGQIAIKEPELEALDRRPRALASPHLVRYYPSFVVPREYLRGKNWPISTDELIQIAWALEARKPQGPGISLFSYLDGRLQCTNPSLCYAEYCYYYITSDRRPLFLAGCVDSLDPTFFFYREDPRTLCRTEHHIGLCVCRAEDGACHATKNETLYAEELRGNPMHEVALATTGLRMEYVRARILQMHLEDFPRTFEEAKDTFYNSVRGATFNVFLLLLILLPILLPKNL